MGNPSCLATDRARSKRALGDHPAGVISWMPSAPATTSLEDPPDSKPVTGDGTGTRTASVRVTLINSRASATTGLPATSSNATALRLLGITLPLLAFHKLQGLED